MLLPHHPPPRAAPALYGRLCALVGFKIGGIGMLSIVHHHYLIPTFCLYKTGAKLAGQGLWTHKTSTWCKNT